MRNMAFEKASAFFIIHGHATKIWWPQKDFFQADGCTAFQQMFFSNAARKSEVNDGKLHLFANDSSNNCHNSITRDIGTR